MGLSKAEPVGTVIECDSQGNPTIRWAKAPKVGDCFYSAPSIPEWTPREVELFNGMISVQKDHAERCDKIANLTMGEKQKAWDMERIALLEKCLAASPQPGDVK